MRRPEKNKRLAHVEIGFIKRQLEHGDVYRRVLQWICIRGPSIVENAHVDKVGEITSTFTPRGGASTKPYSRVNSDY